MHLQQLRCERVLATAGNALMMMGAVGWGSCMRRCSWWWVCRGAAVCADNAFGDDGAMALAPSLLRMTQLTSLDLHCMLRASAGLALWAEAVALGAVAGGGVCEGRAEGRRCVQAIGSEQLGRLR